MAGFNRFGGFGSLRPSRGLPPTPMGEDEDPGGFNPGGPGNGPGNLPGTPPDPGEPPRSATGGGGPGDLGDISGDKGPAGRKYRGGRTPQYGFMAQAGGAASLQDPNDTRGWGWAGWGRQRADPRYYASYLYRPWYDIGYYMPKDPYS